MKQHKWNSAGALQYSDLGLPKSAAQSYYRCEYCQQAVAVHYNSGEGLGEAMAAAGVPMECDKGPEVVGKTKIYCTVNGGGGDMWNAIAICEDGHSLAGHLCSSEGWCAHDLGIGSDWKHDKYREHCPEGYELIWVSGAEMRQQIEQKEGPMWDVLQRQKALEPVQEKQ